MRKIEFGLIEPRLRLFCLSLQLAKLSRRGIDSLRNGRILFNLRLRPKNLSLRLAVSGERCINFLLRGGRPRKAALTIIVSVRLYKNSLRSLQLRLRLLQQRRKILLSDLNVELLTGGLALGRVEGAFGLIASDRILTGINVNDCVPRSNEFIVRHVERRDLAGYLGSNRYDPPVRESVVSRLYVASGEPVINPSGDQKDRDDDDNDDDDRAPAATSLFFFLFRLRIGILRRFGLRARLRSLLRMLGPIVGGALAKLALILVFRSRLLRDLRR